MKKKPAKAAAEPLEGLPWEAEGLSRVDRVVAFLELTCPLPDPSF